jgi:hypothetical protein
MQTLYLNFIIGFFYHRTLFHDVVNNSVSIVSPSANPIGDIGSGYPTNVYDGNRLSPPILRQKMALSGV